MSATPDDPPAARLSPVERFWPQPTIRADPAPPDVGAALIPGSHPSACRRDPPERWSDSAIVPLHRGHADPCAHDRWAQERSQSLDAGWLPEARQRIRRARLDAGSDRSPAWWLNLQADPNAEVLAERTQCAVIARRASTAEEASLWAEFARQNPGFDEYRNLTERHIPVVLLEPHTEGDFSPIGG
jgi:deazaflavin-dependent oxidoreductase (nitroreductase family)